MNKHCTTLSRGIICRLWPGKSSQVSGVVKDQISKNNLSYVNVIIKHLPDSSFIIGTVTGDDGRFKIFGIKSGDYVMELSFLGYTTSATSLLVGKLSEIAF